MTHFTTALHYLIPPLACIGAICVASWTAVATLVYRETRNTRHDAEDAAVFGPREKYGPAVDWTFGGRLPDPDASDEEFDAWVRQALHVAAPNPTPIYAEIAAERLRAELEDESAIERWLSA